MFQKMKYIWNFVLVVTYIIVVNIVFFIEINKHSYYRMKQIILWYGLTVRLCL